MLSIIEQIKQGQLWDFPGGIHPAENKTLSNRTAITRAGVPDELVLPLKQHIGTKGEILVNVGDHVLKGQPLTKSDMSMCVPIHAPTSGTVTAIEQRTTAHPSGLSDLSIVIKSDGEDLWGSQHKIADYQSLEPAELIDAIRLSGIAGLGGAGFPTGRKLQGSLGLADILIINAAECEPYITADDRLMQDYAEEVIEGVRILRHIVKPKLTLIGIEDNKPDAIKALEKCVSPEDNIIIRVIPTKYPSGSSKQLVKILTGREVPSQARSSAVGVVVQNVGTAFAVKRAIIDGEPLIERVVTLTGEAFKQRGNVFARLGTPISYLLDNYGYKPDRKYPRVIIGGSLMGFTLPHPNVPITKITNCILTPKRRELPLHTHEMACIRCSACADACPTSLLPQQLQWYAKDKDYDKCEEYNLFDCIECGACAYVCPSEIPLVNYYRKAKAEIWANQQETANAERAKQRFEAKQARFEREKAARENRFKKAAEDRRKDMAAKGGDDAVAAAIARVKAKQAAATTEGAEKKPAVAAAIARAKAKQAEAANAGNAVPKISSAVPDNSEMAKLREERKRQARERKAAKLAEEAKSTDTAENSSEQSADSKKDAVAAAIARAKARKAAQQADAQPESTKEQSASATSDPKKAAVASAIARAKARKAAQESGGEPEQPAETTQADTDPKKAAVAAAVARAKARKAAQQAQAESPAKEAKPEQTGDAEIDPKKAAVAAAVARAKARKAQQAQQAQQAQTEAAEDAKPDQPAPDAEVDPKKAAVAAAVARAKARKAVQQAQTEAAEDAKPEQPEPDAEVDPKKAAVTAAIARAKARKAAQQAQTEAAAEDAKQEESAPEAEIDPKKAAVAAAVARAKARKAAKEAQEKNEEN
ncbi:electron transport complex subunit RsxC [Photobacterium gaetbulicola]|uniref:Ion-translocating oxidoreductase complex subunit C n=1 Tax=Photobacterium gaetbulicola Gung47 TaxID=658445 RepID=A0A0C5WNW7_9GAMM|nr:electron transport complex subunit RsxC [Photobacterium gaetbulicola]AJR08067.1 electron transport complex protein RnfC [Photobacterium gaetbulicola Gung47]PSU12953.1 electron transport complex subunit RsxC [Photobacterium gaetbulicola]